jgi:hypothetical protein
MRTLMMWGLIACGIGIGMVLMLVVEEVQFTNELEARADAIKVEVSDDGRWK